MAARKQAATLDAPAPVIDVVTAGDAPEPETVDAAALIKLALQQSLSDMDELQEWLIHIVNERMRENVHFAVLEGQGKPTLLKPGASLLISWLKLRPRFIPDLATSQMIGRPGLFAYKCELLYSDGSVVAEGQGGYDMREDVNATANAAIKIAEKRALIDAVIWMLPGLSAIFTQDMVRTDEAPILQGASPARPPALEDEDPLMTKEEEWARFSEIRRKARWSDEQSAAFVRRYFPNGSYKNIPAQDVRDLTRKLKEEIDSRKNGRQA